MSQPSSNEFEMNKRTREIFQFAFAHNPFLDIHVENVSALEDLTAMVLAMKHQSGFDIPAAVWAIPGIIRFIAKSGLFNPLSRWYFKRTGVISVQRPRDTGNNTDEQAERALFKAMLKTISAAAQVLVDGGILGIFAEGTRTPGDAIGEIEKGLLTMVRKAEKSSPGLSVPIVPVSIHYDWKLRLGLPIRTVEIYIGVAFTLSECQGSDEEVLEIIRAKMQAAQNAAVEKAEQRVLQSKAGKRRRAA